MLSEIRVEDLDKPATGLLDKEDRV
jgi:hypothetical protein